MTQRVPQGVLQPARRRRRRRRRWPLLALVALAAGVAVAGWRYWPAAGPEPASAAKTAAARARAARAPRLAPRPELPRAAAEPLRTLPGWRSPRPKLAPASRAAILVDATSGAVLWARRPHERLAIASTTKIMTALLALERLGPEATVTVPWQATRAYPYRDGLRAGERVTVGKLLYGLMLYSGNDDALALAIATSGTRGGFLALMNRRAGELGLRDTHFTTPSGVVDDGNYSSVWDLAQLTRVALRDARFDAIVRTRVKRVAWAAPTFAKVYVNHNKLLGRYPGADGVKTGWTTRAGQCLVASATRGRLRLLAVVLRSTDAPGDAESLLDYGFRTRG